MHETHGTEGLAVVGVLGERHTVARVKTLTIQLVYFFPSCRTAILSPSPKGVTKNA